MQSVLNGGGRLLRCLSRKYAASPLRAERGSAAARIVSDAPAGGAQAPPARPTLGTDRASHALGAVRQDQRASARRRRATAFLALGVALARCFSGQVRHPMTAPR